MVVSCSTLLALIVGSAVATEGTSSRGATR